MSALWSVEAMAQAMRAEPAGPLPAAITGISIDSRSIAPGEAFFAIAGDNRDGHAFVAAALAAGAGLAVIAADKRAAFPAPAPVLVVPDVLAALYDLARAARARSPAKILGVTGSVGKTSTKEALRLALAADGETHASVASYNNHWGVPLSLARCPQTARYAVLEIGMNHAGEIAGSHRSGAPACGDHHHGRACASGVLRLARGDRRRQGRDFPRARAGRSRRPQPRQSAIRPPARARQGCRRRAASSRSASMRRPTRA